MKKHGDFRRTKAELDPQIFETLLAVVAVGAGQDAAAAQAGISGERLRIYVQMGREAWGRREEGEVPSTPKDVARDELFADFYTRFQKAKATPETYMLGLISKAAHGDWKAGAWLLERLYPARFAKRFDVGLEHSGTVTQAHDLSRRSDAELAAFLKTARFSSEDPQEDE